MRRALARALPSGPTKETIWPQGLSTPQLFHDVIAAQHLFKANIRGFAVAFEGQCFQNGLGPDSIGGDERLMTFAQDCA